MITQQLLIDKLEDIKRLAYWVQKRTGMNKEEAQNELVVKLLETRTNITKDNFNKVAIGKSMHIMRDHAKQLKKEQRTINKMSDKRRNACIDTTRIYVMDILKQINRKEQETLLRHMAGYNYVDEKNRGYRLDRLRKKLKPIIEAY